MTSGNKLLDPFKQQQAYKEVQKDAIHSMRQIFEQEDPDEVKLFYTNIEFNSLNRKAAWYNICIKLCWISIVLVNTYRLLVRMFLFGEGELPSVEGIIIYYFIIFILFYVDFQ